jgi:hypothetical protein
VEELCWLPLEGVVCRIDLRSGEEEARWVGVGQTHTFHVPGLSEHGHQPTVCTELQACHPP